MLHPQSRFRSLTLLFCAVVLSGMPLPILDAHPTNSVDVSNQPSLLAHLQSAPACEHLGVADSEVHIHWVSILLSTDGLSDGNRYEQHHDLVRLPQSFGDEDHTSVTVLLWSMPRTLPALSDRNTPVPCPNFRAVEYRISRLLI
jgi:hypothetical protein